MDRLDIIIQKLDSLEAGQKELQGSVKILEGSVKVLEGSVKVLEGSVKSLEAGQKELQGSVKSLEAGQKELYAIVSAIRHRQAETDVKPDSLAMDVIKLQDKVEGLTTQFAQFREETRNSKIHQDRLTRSMEVDLNRTTERLDDHLANRI
jgi:chromosome segregation ATPase